ncbi:MAG: hypothetical protein QXU32_00450 [Nitrososphaerales archaeon]
MQFIKSLAISLFIVLLSGTFYVNAQPTIITFLSMDPLPAQVATGDEVVFSGRLTDIDGNGLSQKMVRIEEERATGSNIIATAITDENGMFSTTWIADLDDPTKDRIMSLSATFAGEGQYGASKSGRFGMRVAIQTMSVSLKHDKPFYFAGDSATFTITFVSPRGEPFDPENIRAIYDGATIALAREDVGLFKFKTPPLIPPKHTLQIVAEKHGYKLFTNAITFDVFTRQALPSMKLLFDWSPKQVMQGMPVTFTLSFTDANNIVMPFVNYDLVITREGETVLEFRDQQTIDGSATHEHIFADGGSYVATVRVNGIGKAPDLIQIRLTSDFNIDVVRTTAFEVKVKAIQKGDAMRITFRNPELSPIPIYSFSLKFEDLDKVTVRAPPGWNVKTEQGLIKINTTDRPLEPANNIRLRILVDGTISSIGWSAMDGDGNITKTATTKVRVIGLQR